LYFTVSVAKPKLHSKPDSPFTGRSRCSLYANCSVVDGHDKQPSRVPVPSDVTIYQSDSTPPEDAAMWEILIAAT